VKRVFGLVVAFGVASCAAAAATTSGKTPVVRPKAAVVEVKVSILQLAPADEYFGPLKMSILGIRNTIRDLGLRYDVNHDTAPQTLASAALTESSIRDWQHKYPKDSQLPRSIFFLQRLYTKVLTQDSRNKARATATWLFASYATSPQARQLKKILATEHLAPLQPPAPPPATNPANDSAAPAPATTTTPDTSIPDKSTNTDKSTNPDTPPNPTTPPPPPDISTPISSTSTTTSAHQQ